VIKSLQEWAQVAGAEVHRVGADNQPGDIIIVVRGDGLIAEAISIVVEARDRGSRALGRKVSSEMVMKMAERNTNAGIYLTRSQDGLSSGEIGEWAEGANDYAIDESGYWTRLRNAPNAAPRFPNFRAGLLGAIPSKF
jgi:hypothetical protein